MVTTHRDCGDTVHTALGCQAGHELRPARSPHGPAPASARPASPARSLLIPDQGV